MSFELYHGGNGFSGLEASRAPESYSGFETAVERQTLKEGLVQTLGGSEFVAGNYEKDAENWHKQSEKNSCMVACQEYVAEQLLDRDFSERDFIDFAKERGWYDPETGTTASDAGKILESLGLRVERGQGVSLNDVEKSLETGSKVICGVNSMVLARPELADLPGMGASHAVEVIGVRRRPGETWVVLNDPGVEGGRGMHVRASTFLRAWGTGGNYAVIARRGGCAI